jgi:hypothetical protein
MQISVLTIEFLMITLGFIAGEANATSLFYGGLVVTCGLTIVIWCSGHVRPGRAEGGGISGPWRFVRHPEVLIRFLLVFGFLLVARAPWIFACSTLILGWFYRRMVIDGDAELAKWMGPQFQLYRLFVPSILPQFMPARLPQQGLRGGVNNSPWSWRKAWARRRKSQNLLLSVLLMLISSVFVWWGWSWHWMRGSMSVLFVVFALVKRQELISDIRWLKSQGDRYVRLRSGAKNS